MFFACAAMATPAKNAYLVDKVAFLQSCNFNPGTVLANIPYQETKLNYMNYLLSLLLLAVLSVNECCQHKTKPEVVTENKPDSVTGTKPDTVIQNQPETKPDSKGDIPACVQKQIDEAAKQSRAEAPVQIDEYLYKGKKVYLFTAPCCDQFNTLYDTNCKAICSPSGGFTGRGDGACKDFDSLAKHVKMIWTNPAN